MHSKAAILLVLGVMISCERHEDPVHTSEPTVLEQLPDTEKLILDGSLIHDADEKEYQILLRRAEEGFANAQYELAWLYDIGKGVRADDDLALMWKRRAAEQGHIEAQYELADHYYQSTPDNSTEVIKWCKEAAEQGHMGAQIMLGVIFSEGNLVDEDQAESTKWYRMAAEQGDAISQAMLGIRYFYGIGVPQDYIQAYAWYTVSGKDRPESADRTYSLLKYKLTQSQIAKAKVLALETQKRIKKNKQE